MDGIETTARTARERGSIMHPERAPRASVRCIPEQVGAAAHCMNSMRVSAGQHADVVDRPARRGYVHGLNTHSEPDPPTALRALDHSTFELLRLLHGEPQLSQRSVAASLGMSLGKVNYCLHSLINLGLVKAQHFRDARNKLSYLYILTPAGVAAKVEMTRDFLARKVREYERLSDEIEQLRMERDAGVRCAD